MLNVGLKFYTRKFRITIFIYKKDNLFVLNYVKLINFKNII